jgi:hypothetical protein
VQQERHVDVQQRWTGGKMTKHKTVGLTVLSVTVLWLVSSRAQEVPISGLYQIISGTYTECCGIAGPFIHTLPETNQTYVQLTVNSQEHNAQMAILGEDLHTVFSTSPGGPGAGFTFLFNTGMVFSDYIQFQPEIQVPENQQSWSYTASSSAGRLRINGVATAPSGGADIPEEFQHSSVLAVLVSTASKPTIGRPRLAANGVIQFTVIDSRGGKTNVIEASNDLVTWTAISTNLFSATTCPICPFDDFQDPVSTNLTRRFYRSFSLP